MANGVRGGGTSLAKVNKPRQKQKRKDTKLTSTSEAIVGSYLKVQRQKQKEQPFFGYFGKSSWKKFTREKHSSSRFRSHEESKNRSEVTSRGTGALESPGTAEVEEASAATAEMNKNPS